MNDRTGNPRVLPLGLVRSSPSLASTPPLGPPFSGLGAEPPAWPRLLERVRAAIRARHYSPRTEKAYVGWIRRYVLFHGERHPLEMGAPEVSQFLSCPATRGRVAASTQNQAFSALLFLHREILGHELGELGDVVRAKRPLRLPLVLTPAEVEAVLSPACKRHLGSWPR